MGTFIFNCNIIKFNMIPFQDGTENLMVILLLQMMSIGQKGRIKMAERRDKLAQMKNSCTGLRRGARTSPLRLILKYKNVADLLNKSESFGKKDCRVNRTFFQHCTEN